MRKRLRERNITPRKIILVICEGETEAAYVEVLKRHYRLPIAIKSKIAGNKINERLINQFTRELNINKEDCITVYVYDADVSELVEKLKTLKGLLILSNPCIELWYLLHFKNLTRQIVSKEVNELLIAASPEWKSYKKGVLSKKQSEALIYYSHVASGRGKSLCWPINPSSNLYALLELLENLKKC